MPKNKGKISAACLTKHFGTAVAVDGIDFTIEAGSYCCLLGPSGCGKTTTLRMISGHDNQTSGTISIDEADMGVIPPAQRPTAMMFQNYALFPHMSVEDNVAFSLRVKGGDRTVRRQRAGHLLEIFGMTTTVTTPTLYALGTVTTVVSFTVILLSLAVIAILKRRAIRKGSAGP